MFRIHHGTTRQWAEEIIENGPDPNFRIPGDPNIHSDGFFVARAEGPYLTGSPEQAARSKANEFPHLGPPVILEIEIPSQEIWDQLIAAPGIDEPGKGMDRESEICFCIDFGAADQTDYGIAKLCELWNDLPKRILPLAEHTS